MSQPKHWIAVASAEHVRIGRSQGFMQVCHGKCAPLRRIKPGDGVAYYSPTDVFRGKDRPQAFTAVGVVKPGEPYQADMGGGFCPYRRDVAWMDAVETPVRPLLCRFAFSANNKNWGYQLRFGLFEIAEPDMQVIIRAMRGSDRRSEFLLNDRSTLVMDAVAATQASQQEPRGRKTAFNCSLT